MTGLILAIDTTTEHGSLALSEGENLIEEVTVHAPTGYSEILFDTIEALLTRNAAAIADIALFAAAAGPGTFTGVRVGLACVKGLAEATGKQVVAVSNLAAIASLGAKPLRAVTLDARRNEVYAALYNGEGTLVLPERVSTLDTFCSALPNTPDLEFLTQTGPLAAAIARIAARAPNPADPALIEANYLRRTDAELHLATKP